MTVDDFFNLFLVELEQNKDLQSYYKFLNGDSHFGFRKAYFIQRLTYIANQINDKEKIIWDCGCGYGTTCLFLAMNGYKTVGSTLEFYFQQIEKRKEFWKKYGNVDLFVANYENIFDNQPLQNSVDYIILQDTLHHLEPLNEALQILKNTMTKDGKMILIEENGNNIIQSIKLFIRRGNKRIISIWDEKLQKNILIGNENIRSLKKWKNELQKTSLTIDDTQNQYIRYYLPFYYKNKSIENVINKEQISWKKNNFLKEYFFFGINFIIKNKNV